ncbi:MAG: ABC transporter permease [Chloroflexota bacterium]
MSRWRSIWLVARREIIERGRSRGFLLSMLFTTSIIIGSFVIPELLSGGDKPTRVGVAQPSLPTLDAAIPAVFASDDRRVELVPVADRAAGDVALAAGFIDALVIVPVDLSGPGEVVFAKKVDPILKNALGTAIRSARVQTVLVRSGVDPGTLQAAQAPPTTSSLVPQTEADQTQFLIANVGVILIFVGIFSFGYTVLTGVVEEKQSRVVEVVLSTVRPRDLLMGKVFGIGVLGLVQLGVFVVIGIAGALITGRLQLPTTTPNAVAMLVLWFILGYSLYATALGFLGALASRVEEASNASTPVTMIAVVSYLVALLAVIDDPNGLVARVATFLPPSAPMVVPLRAALGAIEPWEIAVSVLLTVIAIYGLFVVGGRVYSGAVLQMGGRMKIRDAWRSASE